MATIARPLGWFNWFYHEFGLVSIQATGRNAYLIITARSMRMVSFGMTQVMLGKHVFMRNLDRSNYLRSIVFR